MAVIRAYSLLDKDHTKVSFQAVYRGLEVEEVQADLLRLLEERFGDDVFENRSGLIEEFLRTYREINWDVHARLMHLRNLGVVHLTPAKVWKSLTFDELNTLIGILSRLAVTLPQLCQAQTAFHADALDEYRDLAKKAIRSAGR
jgi:hypothetical protein